MNYPTLYATGLGSFLGVLSDVVNGTCKVTEQLNTSFEMVMQYPINGSHFNEIQLYSVIKCKPNPYVEEQPFVVYKITKTLNGIVTIYAEHISYIMDNGICVPQELYAETEGDIDTAITYLQESAINSFEDFNFSFSSQDIVGSHKWSFSKAVSIREARTNLTNIFGGEWEFNGFSCVLKKRRGENRGVAITYGTNMVDFNFEDSGSDKYTHVMAYWYGLVKDEATGEQSKVLQYSDPKYTPIMTGEQWYFRPYILDCSSFFAEVPAATELSGKALEFIEANPTIGYSAKSYRVQFIQRNKTVEYPHLSDSDHVEIGDSIIIGESRYGVADTRRCVKTTYDVCADRYTEIELGSVKQSISGLVAATAPKTGTTTYGGGYTAKTNTTTTNQKSATAAKSRLVRSLETDESKDGIVNRVKVNYDDGSSWSYQCSYSTDGELLSFGRVTITHNKEGGAT